MNYIINKSIQLLSEIDPSPFFVLSLFPYILFLYWLQKCDDFPKAALWGFRMTLLFVLMTILFAILALKIFGAELTEIDSFHGAAESFLTISDALIVYGFYNLTSKDKVKNS
tara:strand:+ start:921 stop:1256 length:336 start_codon:yes stop_codon:yes gene_type:complete